MKLYGLHLSGPVRLPKLVLDVLALDYEFVRVELFEGEHMKPEYLKRNPQHKIPVLEDGDMNLGESRAIAIYLAQQYDTKMNLLPKCPKKAAIVHQRMYFEATTLFDRFVQLFLPNMFGGKKEKPTTEEKEKLAEAMGWFEDFLKPTGFVANTDAMTIADLAFLSSYSTIRETGDVYMTHGDYPEVNKWFEKMKTLVPNYEKANGEGAKEFGAFYKSKTGF